MATQFSDPALGGTSGFASQYTPIQFAPLVSLTGPIQGPATPTATAPAAPTAQPLRLPMMGGMAEMPDNAYMTGQAGAYPEGMPPIGARSGEQIRSDLMNIGGFFISPMGSMLNYAMTGQTPAQAMQEMFGGAQGQQGQQGKGLFSGLRDFLFGPKQEPVQLPYESGKSLSNDGSMIGAVINDTRSIAESWGLSPDQTQNAVGAAATMVAQGIDPATAVSMALMDASMAASQMNTAGSQFGQPATQGAAPQGMPGLSRNAFDLTAPVAPSPAQTFGVQTGGGYAPSVDVIDAPAYDTAQFGM